MAVTASPRTSSLPLTTLDAVRRHPWRLFIAGEFVEPARGQFVESIDPATEQALCLVPDADEEDVARAVEAARTAFHTWRNVAARERGRLVQRLADVLRAHVDEFTFLDAVDAGLPITNLRNDVAWAAELVDLFAGWAVELKGETIPASAEHLHYTIREPFGVVARIVPYNHPLFFAAGKIAAPLVAGNTVILKPAPTTPLSALRMAELFAEVLPPGTLNVLTGQGATLGRSLVSHPSVRRIAFIGSDTVGRSIQADAAASGVKEVTLELGGKNAMVVLPDADLEQAVQGVLSGMNFIGSMGQSCGSTSRVLVHRSIAQQLTKRVIEKVSALRIGSPLDPTTQMGPLVSEAQRQRSKRYVTSGVEEGARLCYGGRRPPACDRGFFFEPTVFSEVRPQMRLAREEVFGPILSVLTFEEVDDAVEIVNGVEYGLTASVWTRDIKVAHRLVHRLDAGYIWVNGSSRHFWGAPFGGMKASGIGREECLEELLSYTQSKAVHVLLD